MDPTTTPELVSRVVRPETDVLKISRGDWLLVKRRLNHGDARKQYERSLNADGTTNGIKSGMAKISIYLLDWSLVGLDGKTIPIRGKSADEIEAAIDAIDPASATEVLDAITAHEDKQVAIRAAEKKTQDGATGSSSISPLPAPTDGDTNGSATSTSTSTTSSSVN